MTVCIAAMCKGYKPHENLAMIIGATDRMLTSRDIEFEPKIANKIIHFSTAISGMFAGDFGLQTEILLELVPLVKDRIVAEPSKWWKVKEVAELYANIYKKAHLKRAENAVLAPLGYSVDSFHAEQKKMDTELAKQLATKLTQFQPLKYRRFFAG